MKVPASFSHMLPVQGVLPVMAVALVAAMPAQGAETGQDDSRQSHQSHHSHHHGRHREGQHGAAGREHAHAAGARAHVQAHAGKGRAGHASVHDTARRRRLAQRRAAAAVAAASAAKAAAAAKAAVPDNIGTETKLPLPRFASLRADRVYMRRGPGERYPIDWVYHRRGYPVRIEREFGVWRLVEDPDGQKGWVHQVTLHGSRSFLIPGSLSYDGGASKVSITGHADSRVVAYRPAGEVARGQNRDVPLMSSEKPDHKIVALLEPGAVGTIKACPQGLSWCHVTVRGYDGWLDRRLLWGVQPGEIIQPD